MVVEVEKRGWGVPEFRRASAQTLERRGQSWQGALLDARRDGFESAFEQARSRPVLHVIFRKILCEIL